MSTENTTYINYLIEIAKSGRQRGFLDLCEIVLPNIYTVVYRILNDEYSAKRITVKILIHSWQQIKSYDIRKPFIEWIKNTAVLFCIEELNKNTSSPQIFAGDSKKDNNLDLNGLIKTLPTINRVIFVLHDLEGYSYEQIIRFFPELIEDEIKTNLIETRQYLIGSITK